MYNMDLQQQANSMKLFGIFSPVKSCCCGCTLYCAMITFAIFNLLGAINNVACIVRFSSSAGLVLYFILVTAISSLMAYLGFNCKKSELYARLYLTFMKISYFFGLILSGILIIVLAISNEIIISFLQKSMTYNSMRRNNWSLDSDSIQKIISILLAFSILGLLIQVIVGGYFVLVVHSFYVYEWKIRTTYYRFQNQQNGGSDQQQQYMVNQPVIIPIQQQQMHSLQPQYLVQGQPVQQTNFHLQQSQF